MERRVLDDDFPAQICLQRLPQVHLVVPVPVVPQSFGLQKDSKLVRAFRSVELQVLRALLIACVHRGCEDVLDLRVFVELPTRAQTARVGENQLDEPVNRSLLTLVHRLVALPLCQAVVEEVKSDVPVQRFLSKLHEPQVESMLALDRRIAFYFLCEARRFLQEVIIVHEVHRGHLLQRLVLRPVADPIAVQFFFVNSNARQAARFQFALRACVERRL